MIAAKYSQGGSVLSSISDNESMLADLAELDGATNDRLLGEEGLLPGISVHELVYGVRYASIVNAAFTHKNPAGSRFNDGTRGAWYAGAERATSIAEVAYHRSRQLANIDWKEKSDPRTMIIWRISPRSFMTCAAPIAKGRRVNSRNF